MLPGNLVGRYYNLDNAPVKSYRIRSTTHVLTYIDRQNWFSSMSLQMFFFFMSDNLFLLPHYKKRKKRRWKTCQSIGCKQITGFIHVWLKERNMFCFLFPSKGLWAKLEPLKKPIFEVAKVAFSVDIFNDSTWEYCCFFTILDNSTAKGNSFW